MILTMIVPRLFILSLLLCAMTGCVERTLRFTSNVPARVYLDRVDIGMTPVEINFDNYGTRHYTLRADGHEVAGGSVELSTPWYEYPPIDFFAELVIPVNIVDDHHVHIDLEALQPADYGDLQERAEDYRTKSLKDISEQGPLK